MLAVVPALLLLRVAPSPLLSSPVLLLNLRLRWGLLSVVIAVPVVIMIGRGLGLRGQGLLLLVLVGRMPLLVVVCVLLLLLLWGVSEGGGLEFRGRRVCESFLVPVPVGRRRRVCPASSVVLLRGIPLLVIVVGRGLLLLQWLGPKFVTSPLSFHLLGEWWPPGHPGKFLLTGVLVVMLRGLFPYHIFGGRCVSPIVCGLPTLLWLQLLLRGRGRRRRRRGACYRGKRG